MKVATEDFARLATAAAATAKDTHAVPAARMARLEAVGGVLSVMATDFEYWLTMRCPCDGDLVPCMVPANKLAEVAGKLKADTVDVSLDGDTLHIKAKASKRKLAAIDAASFPQLPEHGGDAVAIDAARMKECMAYCAPFLKPGGRDYERGVRIEGSRLRGTDGATVAQIDYGDAAMPGVTVPAALVKAVRDIVPDGDASMIVSEKAVAFEWAEGRISGPVIEGQYPDTDRIVRGDTATKAVAQASELSGAIASVRSLSDGRSLVGFDMSTDGLTLFARSQAGEATDQLAATLDGAALTIGFNADYVERVLRGMGKVSVTIQANGPTDPAIFTSDEASDRLAIVMPMRI